MHDPFALLLDALNARQQVAGLIASYMVFFFGALLIGLVMFVHATGTKVTGRVRAVLLSSGSAANNGRYGGEMYGALYEYQTQNGALKQATGSERSNSLFDKLPGTHVTLYVRDDANATVMRAGYFWPGVGLALMATGLFIFCICVTRYALNPLTLPVAVLFFLYATWRIHKRVTPEKLRESREQFLTRAHTPIAVSGTQLSDAEIRERLRYWISGNGKMTPVMALVALGLIVGGFALAHQTDNMLANGRRAEGQVIRLENNFNSGTPRTSMNYYPVARFTLPDGEKVEFRDRTGGNPPPNRPGDKVSIVYNPGNPRAAIIDHGSGNWLPAALVSFMGILIGLMVISAIRDKRLAEAYLNSPFVPMPPQEGSV